MTDKELLELAAKAAGIEGAWERDAALIQERWFFNIPYNNQGMISGREWNPLTDDGTALRLAVKLKMNIAQVEGRNCVEAWQPKRTARHSEKKAGDHYAATRRAIVRAAAEIGKGIKDA